MKIIKKGKIPNKNHRYVTICENCETQFEFYQNECEKYDDLIDKKKKTSTTIIQVLCPLCNVIVDVDFNDFVE